jgi:hypothetical protein
MPRCASGTSHTRKNADDAVTARPKAPTTRDARQIPDAGLDEIDGNLAQHVDAADGRERKADAAASAAMHRVATAGCAVERFAENASGGIAMSLNHAVAAAHAARTSRTAADTPTARDTVCSGTRRPCRCNHQTIASSATAMATGPSLPVSARPPGSWPEGMGTNAAT